MAYRLKESHLTCPFETTHQILPHRMAQHIIKCRKNYPEMDMQTCPFNATHVISSIYYQAHILECPDKAIVERDIYRCQEVEDALVIKRSAIIIMPSGSLWEEDWEQESVENPYNSNETMINRAITRPPPPGQMGKAGRRAWRQAEIERVVCLQEGRTIDDLVYPDIYINGSTTTLTGGTSLLDSKLTEIDDDKYRLTTSKCKLAMCADQPLRRPKAFLQNNTSRIAANIFKNTLDEDSQNMSKAALKNKKKREAARRRRAEEMCDSESNTDQIQANGDTAYLSLAVNVELTGDPEKDKDIKKIKKKLDAIAKLKFLQSEGKTLEKNQFDKIAMEDTLITELEKLNL